MAKRGRDTEFTRSCIAFDIDGVFKFGRDWSKDGSKALEKVTQAGIPFVFVTNGGGGLTEEAYAGSLTSKIAAASKAEKPIVISPERMVLSYTPWKTMLADGLADQRVLLIGDPREKVLEVAHNYGFKYATHYQDYAIKNDTLNPFRAAKQGGTSHTAVAVASGKDGFSGKAKASPMGRTSPAAEEPFAAILVMCDPYEWYEAHQACVDVLCSPTPLTVEYDTHAPPMPIHFSNPDVLWKSEHPFPRFGQGAFKLALRALYTERLRFLRVPSETIDERVAAFKQWGKPTEATFRFLEARLRELSPKPVSRRRSSRARCATPPLARVLHFLFACVCVCPLFCLRACACVCSASRSGCDRASLLPLLLSLRAAGRGFDRALLYGGRQPDVRHRGGAPRQHPPPQARDDLMAGGARADRRLQGG